jgi:hypothetical protein
MDMHTHLLGAVAMLSDEEVNAFADVQSLRRGAAQPGREASTSSLSELQTQVQALCNELASLA